MEGDEGKTLMNLKKPKNITTKKPNN